MKRQDLYYTIACAVLILAIFYVKACSRGVKVPLSVSIENIPRNFEGFAGADDLSQTGGRYAASADERISRIYTKDLDSPVYLFVGYWENQNEKKKIEPPGHTSDYFWIKQKLVSSGKDTAALKVLLNKNGAEKELIYYGYIVNGRVIPSEYRLRFLNTVNSLLHGRSNAAVLRVSMPVTESWPEESAEEYLEGFIKGLLPLLLEYIR